MKKGDKVLVIEDGYPMVKTVEEVTTNWYEEVVVRLKGEVGARYLDEVITKEWLKDLLQEMESKEEKKYRVKNIKKLEVEDICELIEIDDKYKQEILRRFPNMPQYLKEKEEYDPWDCDELSYAIKKEKYDSNFMKEVIEACSESDEIVFYYEDSGLCNFKFFIIKIEEVE